MLLVELAQAGEDFRMLLREVGGLARIILEVHEKAFDALAFAVHAAGVARVADAPSGQCKAGASCGPGALAWRSTAARLRPSR